MTDTELSDSERELILDTLIERLESLREEMQHTDNRSYKKRLKADRAVIQGLVDKVGAVMDNVVCIRSRA